MVLEFFLRFVDEERRMKKSMQRTLLLFLCVWVFVSCEGVFTTSLVEWAQRDPSQLNREQKINFAKEALASGNRDSMKKAYDALKGTSDPSLQPLAAELAVGAAGVKDALATVLGKVAAGSSEEAIKAALQEAFESFSEGDLSLIMEAATLLASAESGGGTITADQYFITGVGLLVVALKDAGGDVNQIDTSTGSGQTAIELLTKAKDQFAPDSEAAKLLNDFSGYF